MKRRLGRFFARMKGVVKRVWHRFFPPARDDGAAIEPPPPPKLVRAYDGVEDAEYEEVRSSGIPPVARAAEPASAKPPTPAPVPRPVLEPPPPPDDVADETVTELITKVDLVLAADPPMARDEDVTAVADEPIAEAPVAEALAAEAPVAEEPTAEQPTAEQPTAEEATHDRRFYEAPQVVDPVFADAQPLSAIEDTAVPEAVAASHAPEPDPLPALELATESDSPACDWRYETAPLPIDAPTADAPDEPAITAADVDALLAPARDDDTPVADDCTIEAPSTDGPPTWTAPLPNGVESMRAAAPDDDDHRVFVADAREEDLEPSATELGLIAVGTASIPAAEPIDDDTRVHAGEPREELVELTAHELGLMAAPAVVNAIADTAAPRAEPLEIDGEPASAEDVAVVAELDAAIAAAEAAATIPDTAAPDVANELAADLTLAAAIEDDSEAPAPPPAGFNPVPKVEIPSDYVPIAESVHALYQLSLGGFEGPLDLLLFLIKRHQLDIFDIPVAFICERYLECVKVMEDLDIDVAAEFLFMASELLHLKSRMLLPKPEGDTTEEDEIDPRAELVRRLLEYQKYRDAAERFGSLDRLNRDVFDRTAEPQPVVTVGEAPLKEVGLFALVKAFEAVLKRQKPEVRHQVMLEQVSVRKRIRALLQLMETQEPLSFEALLDGHARKIDIVVTFLALLEMGKLKFLRIFQADDGVIYVHPKFDDVSVAFQRLEGMDESQYAG